MNTFTSKFAREISMMLEYRTALGLSADNFNARLLRFDRYCVENYPDCAILSKDLVFGWLTEQSKSVHNTANGDATAIRQLGKYLNALGQDAYILPQGFYPVKSSFMPYIFTDAELSALFGAIDVLPYKKKSTEANIAPVLFRLIYTCGLRPNEGRALQTEYINFSTGEVYITKTKKKKDRIVVMSGDMLALCKQYALQREQIVQSDFFFPRYDGKVYTPHQIDSLFKKCWANANPCIVDLPNVRTYDLRHRFASARLNIWLDEGQNLNAKLPYLRAYMGHKELSETAYYIHMLPENLVKSAGIDWAALNAILPEVPTWEQ